jgi:hypothetical protein
MEDGKHAAVDEHRQQEFVSERPGEFRSSYSGRDLPVEPSRSPQFAQQAGDRLHALDQGE